MAGIIFRGLLGGSAGGGGGGGCGVVLPTVWDDNWDCGTSIDTAGTRFSGANAWAQITSQNLVSEALVGGELRLETSSNGTEYVPTGYYQPVPSGDWTFVTSVRMGLHSAGSAYSEGVGFYLAESATSKSVHFTAGQGFWSGGFNNGISVFRVDIATYVAQQTVGSWTTDYEADLRLSRVSGVLSLDYRLTIGSGSWTTLYSVAQTTPFTTAPDRIGLIKPNSVANVGNTYGYFAPFARTA